MADGVRGAIRLAGHLGVTGRIMKGSEEGPKTPEEVLRPLRGGSGAVARERLGNLRPLTDT
ncbi:hypothetical protein GCM10022233_12470 [Streptomyces shaanxiensis]|uniref:Uncharacterized protein n=1 Tax=Streptomyces shaanxiensis TaxID=653357 RepID=A0ABP7UIW7_9ACTN